MEHAACLDKEQSSQGEYAFNYHIYKTEDSAEKK